MMNKNNLDPYQSVVKDMIITLTDMINLLEITKVETLEETMKHMANILPNVKNIPANTDLEALQKTIKNMACTTPDIVKISSKENGKALQKTIESMATVTTDMINLLEIKDGTILQKAMENVATILPQLTEIFIEVDWDTFQPTDDDMLEAREILHSKMLEQSMIEKFKKQRTDKNLSNSSKTVILVLMILYYTVGFVSDSARITVMELTKNKVIPFIEMINNQSDSERQSIDQLRNSLQKEIPIEICNIFMIVTQDHLDVYEEMRVNSKSKGILHSTNVIQVIEESKDWVHILYEDSQTSLEGWVLSKYLQKIK